jgi:hypothetical protein
VGLKGAQMTAAPSNSLKRTVARGSTVRRRLRVSRRPSGRWLY